MSQAAPRFEMALQQLFSGYAKTEAANVAVGDIKLDSRQVNPGDLFVALKGSELDGTAFIGSAIKRGAVAVAVDATQSAAVSDCDVPVVKVNNIEGCLGELADRFFQHPSRRLSVVGITGTNGKTSCWHYIAQSLQAVADGANRISPGKNRKTRPNASRRYSLPITVQRLIIQT